VVNTTDTDVILGKVARAAAIIENCQEFTCLMPEVRLNIVEALPGASNPLEVAAIDGRITVVRGYPRASGLPQMGASDHMARMIIEAARWDPEIRGGINFRCDSKVKTIVKEYCAQKEILWSVIDRNVEPQEIISTDGVSIPWKIRYLAEKHGCLPRVFYENEALGKEPLFFILGNDVIEAVGIAIEIAKRCYQSR
jgi:hydroxymethylpyrimidine/phosphomethylpyrimidine kinase